MLFFLAQPLPIVPEVEKTFYERGSGKEERTRICLSGFIEKNSRLRVEEIALAFLRICITIISDAFHVYFALLLNF